MAKIMRSNYRRRLERNRKFVDSPLEGTGFELPVRGRGEAGCWPFAAPVCLGRVGSRQSDPATAIAERVSFGWVPDKIGWQKGAPTRPRLAGATTRFIALAYWKFESSPLHRRVSELSGSRASPPASQYRASSFALSSAWLSRLFGLLTQTAL